jgi:hypothetical protein
VLHSEVGAVLSRSLHSSLENLSRVGQLQLRDAWQAVIVHKVGLLGSLNLLIIVHFGIDASLWLILNPLSDEELVLLVIEVTALAFTRVVDPVTFEMVAVSLRKDTVTVALALVPLTFVDVLVGVNHTAFTLGESVDPVAIVSIATLVKEGTSAVLLVFVPVTGVLSAKLVTLVLPVGSLSVALVKGPHTFVLVSVLVELDTEAFLAVVTPVSNVLLRRLPDLALDAAVLLLLLLLHPVHTTMSSVFLSLSVITIYDGLD